MRKEQAALNELQKAKKMLKEIEEALDNMTPEEREEFLKKYGFVSIEENKIKNKRISK